MLKTSITLCSGCIAREPASEGAYRMTCSKISRPHVLQQTFKKLKIYIVYFELIADSHSYKK